MGDLRETIEALRIARTLLRVRLAVADGGYGVAAICIGVGQGLAVVLEGSRVT